MKRIFTLLIAAMAMVACTETNSDIDQPKDNTDNVEQPDDEKPEDEKPEEETPNDGGEGVSINVSIEGNETRIQLDEELRTVWNEDDLLTVFYKSDSYSQWQFQGATGDREGTITAVGTVETPDSEGNIVVLYPDDSNYTYDIEANSVKATVAAEQSYVAGSYGEDGNILVATSTTNDIILKNVYGWLRIELTGAEHSVASIKLTGNKGEQLAGDITINTADATASFTATETPTTALTLTCEGGVTLNSNTATQFYIGLLPQTFDGGITVEITNTEGGTMTKTTEKPVAIERNAIQAMRAFDFVPEVTNYDEIERKFPENTSIWYGNSQLTLSSSPTDANITNHGFGACANGQCYALYSIDFDAEITTINQTAFHGKKLDIIYLPHSVKSIGQSAFLGIQELEDVHIGSGIEEIGAGAFSNCGNLQRLYIRATTPPSLGDYALLRNSTSSDYVYIGALIYVPESAVETYKSHAQWGKYASYIVGYDFVKGEATGGDNTGGGGSTTVSQFNHRLLILDHTDEGCGYCPIAMDRLLALSQSEYKNYYHEVTLHAGRMSSSDPAYSYAASMVYTYQGVQSLPTIYLNYAGGEIERGNSDDYFVNTTMGNTFNSYRSKTGADVGIAMETSVSGSTLNVNVEVTSAKEQRYYLAVWVLENNIQAPGQSSGTKPHHFVYNHALRHIETDYDDTYISGNSLGKMAVGSTNNKSFSINIDSSWVADNLEVLAIVSANDEVVNCALCPANSTLDYEYLSDVEGGNNSGGGEIIEGDDENAIILTNFIRGEHNSSCGYVEYTASNDDGTQVKLYICEAAHELTVVNYSYVVGDLTGCSLVFTSPKSDAGNNGKFHADSVKIDGVSKKVSGGSMTVLQGKMTLTLQFDDGTEQTFVYTF